MQAGDGIDAGRIRNLIGVRAGVGCDQLLALAAEGPLAVEHPAIENQQEAQGSPASLIGGGLVKMLAVAEERRERGEYQGGGREQGNETCREPQPPFAADDLAEGGFGALRAESIGALKRRGIRLACAKTE